jgi:hypothetical protein
MTTEQILRKALGDLVKECEHANSFWSNVSRTVPISRLAIHEAKSALAAQQPAEAEPGYWIVMFGSDTGITGDPKEAVLWEQKGYEVKPVYLHPAPQQPTEPVIDNYPLWSGIPPAVRGEK